MTDVSTEIENEDVTDFGALSDEEFIQSFEPSMDEDASLPAQAADEVTDEADVAPVTDPAVPAELTVHSPPTVAFNDSCTDLLCSFAIMSPNN